MKKHRHIPKEINDILTQFEKNNLDQNNGKMIPCGFDFERAISCLHIDCCYSELLEYIIRKIENCSIEFSELDAERKRIQDKANKKLYKRDFWKKIIELTIQQFKLRYLPTNEYVLELEPKKPELVIEDESLIPEKYRQLIPKKWVDKQYIFHDLQSGVKIDGCYLKPRTKLKIRKSM